MVVEPEWLDRRGASIRYGRIVDHYVGGFHRASHGGSSAFRNRAGSYDPTGRRGAGGVMA